MPISVHAGHLPEPPANLFFNAVSLRFLGFDPGDIELGYAPFYPFRIRVGDCFDVGQINLRIGDTAHVRLYVGHIGYEVDEPFRGHHYAEQACRALAPFVRSIYPAVIITSDPDNRASIRTIERLGALFLGEVAVPQYDSQFLMGSRRKRRYQWAP
ncbi:MAG: GNAT family N-acetyltransferase [Verrucomicrobiota bacterium]